MPKFIRKPTVIEAEQFWPEKKPWPDGVYQSHHVPDSWKAPVPTSQDLTQGTTRTTEVKPGDWVILPKPYDEDSDPTGRDKPFAVVMRRDVFEKTYELVEDGAICPRCGKRSETIRKRACCGDCMCDDCEPEHAWTDDDEEDEEEGQSIEKMKAHDPRTTKNLPRTQPPRSPWEESQE
jgi:hypothetical protein